MPGVTNPDDDATIVSTDGKCSALCSLRDGCVGWLKNAAGWCYQLSAVGKAMGSGIGDWAAQPGDSTRSFRSGVTSQYADAHRIGLSNACCESNHPEALATCEAFVLDDEDLQWAKTPPQSLCRAECKAILASVMPAPTSSSADAADPVCEQACDLKASLQGIRGQCSSPSAYENDDACAPLRDLSTHVQKACSVDPDSAASEEVLPAGVSMATLLAHPIVVSLTPSACSPLAAVLHD